MRPLKTYLESNHSQVEANMRRRINDHISRVIFFYKQLLDGGMIPQEDQRLDEVLKHDKDKLKPANLKVQALRFLAERTPEENQAIENVVRRHIKTNPHHFEYWGTKDQDHHSSNIHCEKVPDKYLYEMIVDWQATAEERGNSLLSFYESNQGSRFIFSKHQDEIIRRCAKYLEKFVGPSRTYSDVYLEPRDLK